MLLASRVCLLCLVLDSAGESPSAYQDLGSSSLFKAFDPFLSTIWVCSLTLSVDHGMRTVAALFKYYDWKRIVAHPDLEEDHGRHRMGYSPHSNKNGQCSVDS